MKLENLDVVRRVANIGQTFTQFLWKLILIDITELIHKYVEINTCPDWKINADLTYVCSKDWHLSATCGPNWEPLAVFYM